MVARPPDKFLTRETVPALRGVFDKHLNVDLIGFRDWLAHELSEYEQSLAVQKLTPARHEEYELVAQLVDAAEAMLQALNQLPYATRQNIENDTGSLLQRVRRDMRELGRYSFEKSIAIAETPAKMGKRPNPARDLLLHAVDSKCRELGYTAMGAKEVTEKILIACRVPVAGNDTNYRNAMRRARKLLV